MSIIDYILKLYHALILTLIIEIGIALLLKIRNKKDLSFIAFINCVTNPAINYLLLIVTYIFRSNNIVFGILLLFEFLVILIEYSFYKKRIGYKRINKLLFSFILNMASFGLGLIISYF